MEGGALKLLLIVAVMEMKTDEKDRTNVNCCEEGMDEERGGKGEGEREGTGKSMLMPEIIPSA